MTVSDKAFPFPSRVQFRVKLRAVGYCISQPERLEALGLVERQLDGSGWKFDDAVVMPHVCQERSRETGE